ncbi:MAG: NTP transferase domain-containing protein [Candidatus Eremiobacterota bacterium]
MTFPNQVESVLLAGGRFTELPEGEACPPGKGLVPIGGLPMAARPLRALRDSARVRRVILVSPVRREELEPGNWDGVDTVIEAGASILESYARGVRQALDLDNPVLSVTGDLPFLTEGAVTDFVERCSRRPEVSVWYGFLRRENSERVYPGLHHTWARLAEGTFCGTGLIMIRPRVLDQVEVALRAVTQHRKNPLRLAGLLGWDAVLAYLFRRLTVARAERAGERLLGVPCAGIESPYAETAFNVDDLPTLVEARRLALAVEGVSG